MSQPMNRRAYTDSTPETETFLREQTSRVPAWRKLELTRSLTQGILALSLAGLRRRNAAATEPELRRLLADIILGSDLAMRVYGSPLEMNKDTDIE
jgi:hypothetical protein